MSRSLRRKNRSLKRRSLKKCKGKSAKMCGKSPKCKMTKRSRKRRSHCRKVKNSRRSKR